MSENENFYIRFGENETDPTFFVNNYSSQIAFRAAIFAHMKAKFTEAYGGTDYATKIFFGNMADGSSEFAGELTITKSDLERIQAKALQELHKFQAMRNCPAQLKQMPDPTMEDCINQVALTLTNELMGPPMTDDDEEETRKVIVTIIGI